jgi:hypothetical protein
LLILFSILPPERKNEDLPSPVAVGDEGRGGWGREGKRVMGTGIGFALVTRRGAPRSIEFTTLWVFIVGLIWFYLYL